MNPHRQHRPRARDQRWIFAGGAFVEKMLTATVIPEHFDKIVNTNARGTYFTVGLQPNVVC